MKTLRAGLVFFEDVDKFRMWLNIPCVGFNGHSPLEMIKENDDWNIIYEQLCRIEHGIFI